MKKFTFFLGLILIIPFIMRAQTIGFHETFELPSLADSMTTSLTGGVADWAITTKLHHGAGSLRADSCAVHSSGSTYLTSAPFSTLGNFNVMLQFSQICKVIAPDKAVIEVSTNGTTWTQLAGAQYISSPAGQFATNGNSFNSNSYGALWAPQNSTAIPQNTWWKVETFDLSTLIGNVASARIRFKLTDGGAVGGGGNYGWIIDNIKVTMAASELIPPVITILNPELTGIIFTIGPFTQRAKITDASSIDTAKFYYSVNGGPETILGMTKQLLDTFAVTIPAVSDSDQVCWHIEAWDDSPAHNHAANPATSTKCFTAYAGITFPFYDDFDHFNLWTASGPGQWELGTPNYGQTNSAHSAPNSWDVNLNSAYVSNADCYLVSPVFDFSNAVNTRLSFWLNYQLEAGCCDGTKLEYTTDGTNWTVLGTQNDPLATNWYNATIGSSSIVWGNSSGGWQKSKYKLSAFNNISPTVRFRYYFHSDGSNEPSGVSVDDFSLTLPATQEAAIDSIIYPVSGCGLGNEIVKIRFSNAGLTAINGNLQASYKKGTTVITEPVTNIVQANGFSYYTFATPVDLSVPGLADQNYTIKAWVSLVSDPNHYDDTTSTVITSKYLPLAPVVTNSNIPYGTTTTINATSSLPVEWYSASIGGTLLGSNNSLTIQTPLYGTTIFYVESTGPNGCKSIRAQDTVFVGQAPPLDASIIAITSPISGVNLTSAENVTINIKNYGTQPITGFHVYYKVNNLPQASDQVNSTIPASGSLPFTFSSPCNLSAYQTYNIKAWVVLVGDANHINDTVNMTVVNSMFPYCESKANNSSQTDIGNLTLNNCNNGNPDPIINNSNATNVYTDFSQTVAPIFLMRGQTYPVSLSPIYEWSAYDACAKIFVDWNYNGTFEEATETAWVGPVSILPWTTINLDVPVTATLGYTRLRVVLMETSSPQFVHACGTYDFGETEDYTAFIIPQIPHDAGVVSITAPPQSYPQGYNQPVKVVIKNCGTLPINTVSVTYEIDNQNPQTTLWSNIIQPAATDTVTFPPIVLPTGQHSICAWTTLQWDSIPFNDTICRGMFGVAVDTLNFCDNFDGVSKFQATESAGTNWINGAPTGAFPPNGAQSAPNVWATNLNGTGYTNSTITTLTTQLFDWTGAINARLTFKYTCNTETSWDGTRLEYSIDGGTTWQILGSINDPMSTNWYTNNINSSNQPAWAGTIGWTEAKYKLNAFVPGTGPGQVQFMRFRFVFTSDGSGSGPTYKGMAIDDFCINVPCHQDAMADSIIAPHGEIGVTTQTAVSVRIKNNGIDPLTNIPLHYQINNNPVVNETWLNGNALLPDATMNYTFTTQFLPPVGSYTLCVWTDLSADCDRTNDTLCTGEFGIPVYTVPFEDHFDSANYSVFYAKGTQWEHGAPTSNTINTAHSQPYCWKTNLDGIYLKTSMSEYLYSPQFDFTQGLDSLKFYHWAHIFQNDGGTIEYLGSDNNWWKLGMMGDMNATNWYNSGTLGFSTNGGVPGWHESTYDLKIIQNFAIPTQFRFKFNCLYTNTSFDGWAVDDFELTSPKIQYDGGVINILSPTSSIVYGTDLNVQVTIKNFGWDTLTSVPVKYQLNGITVGATVWNGVLLPGQTTTASFPSMPSPLSDFTLCAYTDIPFDTHFQNDTSCTFVPVIPPDYDVSIKAILEPVSLTILGNQASVKVQIKNLGLLPVSSIPLVFTVGEDVINEVWSSGTPLATGQETDYTFATLYKFEYLGWYYLCAYTDISNDGYRANDTLCVKLENKWTGINDLDENGMGLSQNIPNPANDNAQVVYYLPKPGQVTFKLTSFLGQEMYAISSKETFGEHVLDINTSDYPAGLYYYYIEFEGKRLVRKMIITH